MNFDFSRFGNKNAIIWRDQEFSYAWLSEKIEQYGRDLINTDIGRGSVVSIESDFHPLATALFFALARHGCIIVPLIPDTRNRENLIELGQVQYRCRIDGRQDPQQGELIEIMLPVQSGSKQKTETMPRLYQKLRELDHPGLVLFSSGTTGSPKAAVHDLQLILKKFAKPRRPYRSIAFLFFDHIGGVNTMLYILSSGGCLVTVEDRRPDTVLKAVEKHQVELLPASPTFLHMILLSEAYRQYNLNSLQVVSYGTEPMPESTLHRFHQCFPDVRMQQTYGLSEIGIPATKSKASDSLWLTIGGQGVETRVVDGILHIRSQTAMLGYLNAPDPFSTDGWLNTGDAVATDGEYIRFLGRRDHRLNVGGEKVYPAEVENILLEINEIVDAFVYGERNLLTGTMVVADVQLRPGAPAGNHAELRRKIREYCGSRLARFKVPARINFVDRIHRTERGKKKV